MTESNADPFAENRTLREQIAQLKAAVAEYGEQHTATAEILKVIASSPSDVQPVFDAILRSAVTLCGAEIAAVFPYDGKLVHLGATHNWSEEALQYFSKVYPAPPSPALMSGRTILGKSIVKLVDAAADGHYDPDSAATGHWRRMLGVPMLREGQPLGALVVSWRDPGETSQRQVDLLQTFADQAVIAIENVRLFNETKEALERQTATSEILRVISSSPNNVKPVFDTIARNALTLCGGRFANVFRFDGELVHWAASENYTSEALQTIRETYPMRPDKSQISGRAILSKSVVCMQDALADPDYDHRHAIAGGWRRMLGVPMMHDGVPLGAIVVGWRDAGPVSPVQEQLLKTFADQAVIAIQNVRLFHEIEDKNRQLQVASQRKSEFLANMSHELRTPLNAVIGFSEVLQQRMFGELTDKQSEYVDDIHSSGAHLLSLINDILDLSKVEAGRMELDVTPFSVPMAIDNALTLIKERAGRHGIALESAIDPAVGDINADERKMKQILLNLLSNAVKFTPDGGRIAVAARPINGGVEISVTDTGIGIAPEDCDAVFEEFRQVGPQSDTKAEGTGLGLALARKFVEMHRGKIGVTSEVGEGSKFTFSLLNCPPQQPVGA